jgi:hypothetical protein
MVSKSFSKFLQEHEARLERLLSEDTDEVIEDSSDDNEPVQRVVPKQIVKVISKPVSKPVIKESSTFNFCSSCGQKHPSGAVVGKFCTYCGKPTMMSTNGTSKIASKKNGISENVDYASSLLSDDSMEQSRLLDYLEKNPVRNPISEMIKESNTSNVSSMDRASELLDGCSDNSGVKLLEMPDFSKFMPQQPKQPEVIKETSQPIPEFQMAPSNLQINDPAIEAQMRSLGLV